MPGTENALITVMQPELTEAQRGRIRQTAAPFGARVDFWETEAEALPHLADTEILFTGSAALLNRAPKLRWLCTTFAGVDRFAAPGGFPRPEVLLTNSAGAYGVTISEHIVMALLMLLRRQPEYSAVAAARRWERGLAIRSVFGLRLTVLGTGDIGRETARRLKAFSPRQILGVNRRGLNPEPALFDRVLPSGALETVLPETDALILCAPGTRETAGLLSAERLRRLPEGALIVNVGRGSILDEAALAEGLRAGRLGGAALDVFQTEPLPPDSPLWDCPNLLITPHISGNLTLPHTVERVVELFCENLPRYFSGQPLLHRVDLSLGY